MYKNKSSSMASAKRKQETRLLGFIYYNFITIIIIFKKVPRLRDNLQEYFSPVSHSSFQLPLSHMYQLLTALQVTGFFFFFT